MKCLVIDDNEIAREVLKQLISEHEDLVLEAECKTSSEALLYLKSNNVDVIFLDIEMPETSGLEFLRKLKTRPIVIIVSGHEKYAVDSYEFNVADYLVKPVRPERFELAINRVKGMIEVKNQAWEASNKDFIFIRDNSILQKVNFTDIQWLESQGDYVKVHTPTKPYMVHSTLKSIEEKLPTQRFIRVHRSFLVSLDKIDRIEENLIYIKNKAIPVSESYWKTVKSSLNIL